jgi:hypothetical protein
MGSVIGSLLAGGDYLKSVVFGDRAISQAIVDLSERIKVGDSRETVIKALQLFPKEITPDGKRVMVSGPMRWNAKGPVLTIFFDEEKVVSTKLHTQDSSEEPYVH